jgi:hypothetical protein
MIIRYLKIILTSLVTPVLVILGIGLTSAMVSPTVWQLLNSEYALEKVFQKTGLLLLALLAIYTVRATVFKPQSAATKLSTSRSLARLACAWLFGVLSLSIPICVLISLKIRIADTQALASITHILGNMIVALWIGLIVGLVEEYIFRGWLLGWLQTKLANLRYLGSTLAVSISAFYFAMLHFLKPAIELNSQHNTLSAGMDVFLRSLKHLFEHAHVDTLIALFLAGLLLGLIKIVFNNGLILVIGIHAGWVFTLKTTKTLTNSNPGSQWNHLVGQDGIIGYLSAGWLSLIVLTLIVVTINKRNGLETCKQ